MQRQEMKAKFLELLERSTITQAYITIAVITTACVLWGMQVDIPDTLQTIIVIVIGFFFGTKTQIQRKKGE